VYSGPEYTFTAQHLPAQQLLWKRLYTICPNANCTGVVVGVVVVGKYKAAGGVNTACDESEATARCSRSLAKQWTISMMITGFYSY
jgi:hypothetical protein